MQSPSSSSMGMYQTRASPSHRDELEQSVNVKQLKDKFTELGLSLRPPLNPYLVANLEGRLGVSAQDLPTGITDEQLRYLHNKGHDDDQMEQAESGSESGLSPCHTRADSLDGEDPNNLLDVTQSSSEKSQGTISSCSLGSLEPSAPVAQKDAIDDTSCGSVKELCKKFSYESSDSSSSSSQEEWLDDRRVKQSVLAVIQVASSVALACGLDEALEVREAMLEDPGRSAAARTMTSQQQQHPLLENIGSTNVKALKQMFEKGSAWEEEEEMEICTRL